MKFFLATGLLLAISLQFWQLERTPVGFDMDEAQIVLAAKESIKERSFFVYSPNDTHWEMLAGYLFALFEKVGNNRLRYLASLMSLIELLIFFFTIRKFFSPQLALSSTAFLALMPWHQYYARIIGTCNGVVLFGILSIYCLPGRLWQIVGGHLLGLAYYTTYRLLVIQMLAIALIKKNWKQLITITMAIGLFFLMVWFSSSSFGEIFFRGSYNYTRISRWQDFLINYFYTIIAPFSYPLPYYQKLSAHFIVDYVHTAMMVVLRYDTPLSWAGSVLILFGIAWHWKTFWSRRHDPRLQFCLSTFLLIICALGFMGPSMGRLTLLMPLFALAGGYFLLYLPKWAVVVTLSFMSVSSVLMVKKLQDQSLMEPYFHSRLLELDQFIRRDLASQENAGIYVIVNRGFQTMGLLQSNSDGRYRVFPIVDPVFLAMVINNNARPGVSQWVIFDQHPAIPISPPMEKRQENLKKSLEYFYPPNSIRISNFSNFAQIYQLSF